MVIFYFRVSGVPYETSKYTLERAEHFSLFREMVRPDFDLSKEKRVHQDPDGTYIIDRNGFIFQYVLDYLRIGRLTVPSDFAEFDLLYHEAGFYGLITLKSEVRDEARRRNIILNV